MTDISGDFGINNARRYNAEPKKSSCECGSDDCKRVKEGQNAEPNLNETGAAVSGRSLVKQANVGNVNGKKYTYDSNNTIDDVETYRQLTDFAAGLAKGLEKKCGYSKDEAMMEALNYVDRLIGY